MNVRTRLLPTSVLLSVVLAGGSLSAAACPGTGAGQSPAPGATSAGGQSGTPSTAMEAYQRAMEWWTANAAGESTLLSPEDHAILGDGLIGGATPEARALIGKLRPYLDFMRAGGLRTEYGVQLDRTQGFALTLPHLSGLRNAARALRLEAELRMADGDLRGAIESIRATTGFSAHVRTDDILVSSLVSASIATLNDRTMEQLLGRGGIDAEMANELAESLEALRGKDPLRLENAIRSEAEMLRTTIEKSIADGTSLSDLIGFGVAEPGADLGPDQLREQLTTVEALYAEAAEAAVNPDRDAARAALAELQERVAAGEGGLLASMVMPAFGKSVEAGWKLEDMIAQRYQLLDDIRSGRVQAASFANAAYPYLTAAALVAGLDRPAQEAVEAARVAYGALDAPARERARRELAKFREPLRKAFGDAAQRERCDFSVSRVARPALLMDYLPGLRGAVRIALTDAIVASGAANEPPPEGARGSDAPPFTIDEAVGAALRAARHLASDPAIGHSLVAASIISDAAAALSEANARAPLASVLPAERLEALRAVSSRLTGPDPLGIARALDRERALLGEALRRFGVAPEGTDLLLKRHSEDLSSAALIMQIHSILYSVRNATAESLAPTLDRIRGADALEAPLLGTGDLVRGQALRDMCGWLETWLEASRAADGEKGPPAPTWIEFVDAKSWPQTTDLATARDSAAKALTALESVLTSDRAPERPESPQP